MSFSSLIPKVYSATDDFVGNLTLPGGIPTKAESTTPFITGIVRFLIVIAGVFSLWNFLTGGFQIITSGGDKAKLIEAQNKIQFAIVGLVVIAGSFILAGIAGQLLFGNFTFILAPELQSVN